ncbi:hypothetical protein Q1695_016223 [Nippostrongylus brasiliensis]|nr:hypothetical protein Q1695_016223 [Nippostrongylus brasiliensis]
MSLWFRPATILPRFVEECMRDFRHMERMMFTPLYRTAPFEVPSEANSEVIDNDTKFAITMDVSKFKPEDLKVNIDGRQLTIEGKEEINDNHGYSMRSFVRQWMLPEDVNLESIRSSLNEAGRLSIEAPKITKAQENARTIPIERVNNEK